MPEHRESPRKELPFAANAYLLQATTNQLHKKEFSPEEKVLLLVGGIGVL